MDRATLAQAFPTCVGMNRAVAYTVLVAGRVPHVRGDEPPAALPVSVIALRSPRAWG